MRSLGWIAVNGNPVGIPEHTHEALQRYATEGIRPGDFLYAVLTNDLKGAISRADTANSRAIKDIVVFCSLGIPSSCWGSPDKVHEWLANFEVPKIAFKA